MEWFLLGLTEEQFDIYILDAEMPVKNGIEVAKEIRKLYPEPVIIYVTNHLNYAVEAYEVNTYRYIAKDTMEKGLNAAYETLLPILLAKEERYYIVKKRSELEKIAYSDIFYVKKEGKCAVIVHRNGETSVSGRKGIGFQRIYRGLDQRLSCKYQTCDENEEQRALYAKR